MMRQHIPKAHNISFRANTDVIKAPAAIKVTEKSPNRRKILKDSAKAK